MSTLPAEARARAALSWLVEPDDALIGQLLALRGPVAVVDALRSGRLAAPVPATEATLRHVRTLVEGAQLRQATLDVDALLATAARLGGRLVCPGDEEWPGALDDLGPRAPYALWVRGPAHLASITERAVAIVGTRVATAYGELMATRLGAELAESGWTVLSGGAYGIDAAAHRGALAAGRPTVAVLACGVDVSYPRGHDALFARIAGDGLIVSELPPGAAPHRHRFLTRNRLIAALTAGTVVVEAALRSGARNTAGHARDLGRAVMAVPGPVTSAASAGCHHLLREDPSTVLVTGAAEVAEMIGRIGVDLAPVARAADRPRDRLDPTTAQVLDAVPVRRARGPARIASTAGLPLATVEAALGQLYLGGFVEPDEGGWRLSPLGRTGDARAARPDPNGAGAGPGR